MFCYYENKPYTKQQVPIYELGDTIRDNIVTFICDITSI